ncbi:MAG: serine/threonine protein kinase, partial [Deltaproteobacteria bacterium]|nr:serine/threonine protein kinase [Deltaproteobacteria bacterium]
MTCVADEVIAAWLSDSLPADERAAALAHAQGCAACTDVIGALFATGRSVAVAHLGRYVITGALGAGGMGVVMRATDPALGRDVAIKMVKAAHTDDADDGFRHRMLGEAQAMAKVRHSNVVTVHDVGTAGDEIYVAMELVAGAPLGRWLADDPPVAARIEALLGIGRGLAAVHAAALVHRDIKPDNIVIRDDGTAVIVDFGLALGAGPAGSPAIAGTPTFIAPEVRAGAIATAASDQFQWWRLVEEGVGALPPRAAKRLAPALARGLDPDPARRHRDMAAAVAALAGAVAPRASSRWMIAIAAAGIASAAITAIATMRGGEDDACASAPLTGWSPARRAALATSLRDAGADAPRVLAALDRRAATTIALRAQA